MKKYLNQLLQDILEATENVPNPHVQKETYTLANWISEKEEERISPEKNLEEWTGILQAQLPPAEKLNDIELETLLAALKKMLEAYNCHVIFIFRVSLRIEYQVLKKEFSQPHKFRPQRMGFFRVCKEDTPTDQCVLGDGCQCAYFNELSKNWIDEDLSPEEERRRALDIEVTHIKRKYGRGYMKYYPFHLDPEYDDEYGNPHDYGFSDLEDDEDDDWWRK